MAHNDSRYDDLIEAAVSVGWAVTKTANHHYRFLSPDKRVPPIIGANSTEPRAYKNLRAMLRRHGVPV